MVYCRETSTPIALIEGGWGIYRDSVTREWDGVETDMGRCGLTEEETSVTVEEGEKTVKASQRRWDFSQFLKMIRICKAGNQGMGMREVEGKVLVTWYDCVVFALKSSTYTEAGLLPCGNGDIFFFADNFLPLFESDLWDCICLGGSSVEN